MPFIKFTEEEKERANATSIADYLTAHGESVKRAGREYMWDAPSGKVSINGGEWYSQYEQVGGGAVNFVRKFYGLSYPEAVRSLLGSNAGTELSRADNKPREEARPPFTLPPKNTDMRRVYGYLVGERLIDRDVLTTFVRDGLIYEDAEYHNAVFVGSNPDGVPCHAQKRSTSPVSDFKGNLTGSIAEYSFHFVGESDCLFVFEAPIDMLAYISMNKQDWEKHSYVALCSTADRAACQMLKDHPNLKTVFLCLDHDSAGIEGCYRLAESIHAIGEYSIWRKSPRNKDWDEDLKERAGRDCIPSSEHPKLEYITDSCDDLSTCNVGLDPDLASFSRFPNDIVEDGLTKLKLLYRQNEPYTMAKVCLAICYYRDRMIGQEQDFSHYVWQMQAIYRPHRDTLNWDYIWNHQMVSPAFMREIELATKMTNDFICDSHGIIVTEYCKKEDTWVAFRDTVSYTPSDRFIDELMPEGLVKEQEESAQKEQKGVDDLKYVMQIIEPGAEYWQKLFVEGVKRGALKYSDQTWLKQAMEFASKGDIPCSSSGKVPYKTMTMAKTVMEIKERLESLGIKI